MESSALRLKKLLTRKPALTLAVAESLTGGHLQALLTSVSGSSDYFLGGITAYGIDQKVKLLGVDRAHAKKVNCVSARVAAEMAFGAAHLFGADLALATTGYAEPSRAQKIKAPMAWWAIYHRRPRGKPMLQTGTVELPGAARIEAQQKIAQDVVWMLEAYLLTLGK